MVRPPATLTRRQRRLRRGLRFARRLAVTAAVITAIVLADRAGLFGRRPIDDRAKYDGCTFRVVRVIDGDTLDIAIPDGSRDYTRIRLWGVDTPETVKPDTPVQHFGPEASAQTRQLTLDKDVTLQLDPAAKTRDNQDYRRLLAYVILPDGRMLNRLLIENGYGYADPRYDHQFAREFAALQDQAHAAGRGLWAQPDPDDLPYDLPSRLKTPAR